ncbi:Tetratricopeptide repeat protein 1 [Orchesella cincta]|uniref:Tetratricopeptide repeat protein 1 n=1 Tax=Orchesella cincta TaxID=48709 RepID=A0A1D2N4H5_ORCCI|nr:Tetratricopeptide repeat protein 1 [Orchesella cincta]
MDNPSDSKLDGNKNVSNNCETPVSNNENDVGSSKDELNAQGDFEKLALNDESEEANGVDKEESESGESKEPPLADDYVDEEALKAEEEKLTPEELSERLTKAKEHKDKGNEEFKEEQYRESIMSYTKGLLQCPLCEKELRSILYANRGAAKIKIGCKDLAVMDCSKSLEYNPDYMKSLIRRAKLYEELDKLDEALEDYKKIVSLDPSNREALIATQRLPPIINERNEKLKTEMLGKSIILN